ncbi:cytochrome c oxidase assembly protein [Leifsonia sp. L25]|uniref:cytochrome c oxidase assembly protein n=1 Tax=Actinomycetes TaxID=1760 RepID=UPI003D689F67
MTDAPARPAARHPLLLWATAAIPLVSVVVTVAVLGSAPYEWLSREYPGLPTSYASALLRLVTDAATAVALGSLVVAAFVVARKSRTAIVNDRDLRFTRIAASVWLGGSILLIPVDAADASGRGLSTLLEPGAFGYLVTASYLPGAWIVSAVCALVVLIAANVVGSWVSTVVLAAIAALGMLAPVMVGQVLVGPNHDFAGDAAIFGTPATGILLGATVTMLVRWSTVGPPGPRTAKRFRTLVLWCWAVALAADSILYYVQSAGEPVTSATGILFILRLLVPMVFVLGAFVVPRKLRTGLRRGQLVALLVSCSMVLGITSAMLRIPPPVYFVPTSTQQLFLGYNVDTPMTPVTLFLDGRVNILFLVISVAGTLVYLLGVRTLRRRGDAWPVGRTISWILGWASVVITTSSGIGPYSSASFAVHMGLHMSLNMLGPLLLVLGGPVTLFLRATTAHRKDDFAGPHEWINAMLHSRATHLAFNPLYALVVFVGSYYAIYMTPFFDWAMRYHWAHQAMTVHYLLIGYIFYALVIGVDAPPRPLPHLGKLGLVLAAMPFHAFFGVIVMTSTALLAGTYYHYLDVSWIGSLHNDQYVAGGIAWSAGEVPLVIVVLALVTQWARQDAKLAARTDRHLDAGLDDSYEAYNQMLAKLAERRQTTGATASTRVPVPDEESR